MTSEQPLKIAVTEDALAPPKRKLDYTRLPDEANAAEWAYGALATDIKRLASKWKDGYGWRTHERELNAFPMFKWTSRVLPSVSSCCCSSTVVHRRLTLLLRRVIIESVRRARKIPRGDRGAVSAGHSALPVVSLVFQGMHGQKGFWRTGFIRSTMPGE